MNKTRVNNGCQYWLINSDGSIGSSVDFGHPVDEYRFKFGNYFKNEQNARKMRNKLRAVLAGADVIDVTTANVDGADELDAKKHQIELILSHRQTIVIAENNGTMNWYWNTKSIESRNEMIETVIQYDKIDLPDKRINTNDLGAEVVDPADKLMFCLNDFKIVK